MLILVTACDIASSSSELSYEPAFGDEVFSFPVDLVPEPARETFLLAEQGGLVLRIHPGGSSEPETVLDLRKAVATDSNEVGLLSIAFDPAYTENRHLWAYYLAPGPLTSVVSRFTLNEQGVAIPGSELKILELEQPYGNHNGGALRFGPDGMLYLGFGDGGNAFDPHDHGQDTANLLSSIIRLDVSESSEAEPYAIPSDNPFVDDDSARDEIWAYGFRNPWRMSFDAETGELWVGDVGQDDAEEVNLVESGGNYGWSDREGHDCLIAVCNLDKYEDPLFAYDHDQGCSITGGVVYRGQELPDLQGNYVFGDLCNGNVWFLDSAGQVNELPPVSEALVSITQGHDGEIYFVTFTAPIVRLTPS